MGEVRTEFLDLRGVEVRLGSSRGLLRRKELLVLGGDLGKEVLLPEEGVRPARVGLTAGREEEDVEEE